MASIPEYIFWITGWMVAATYILYPLFLLTLKPLLKEPKHECQHQPFVSVVIATFNEAKYLDRRIRNIMEQNYPASKIELVIVSDGSSDNTQEVLKKYSKKNINIIQFPENRGKADAVNAGVDAAKHEIIVFADSRQLFSADAIENLVGHFNNSKIGAVSGELVLTKNEASTEAQSMGNYWKYEKMIRFCESRLDSVVGVTGAIYAVRRSLYLPLPERTMLDDVVTPLRVIKQGYRVIMDPNAKAYEPVVDNIKDEFRRKVRTLAGNFEVISILPWVIIPWRNRVFLQWFFHKFMRLIVPYALILFLISSALIDGLFFRSVLVLQIVAYTGAALGWIFPRIGLSAGVLGIFTTIVMLNIAAVVGLFIFIGGDKKAAWKK